MAVSVLDASGSEVDSDTLGDAEAGAWGQILYTASLDVDPAGYTAEATDEYGIVVASTPGRLDLEAAILDLDTAEVDITDLEDTVSGLIDTIAALPSQAAYVEDADDTDAASVAAAVNTLRDALIDAGVMAGPPAE